MRFDCRAMTNLALHAAPVLPAVSLTVHEPLVQLNIICSTCSTCSTTTAPPNMESVRCWRGCCGQLLLLTMLPWGLANPHHTTTSLGFSPSSSLSVSLLTPIQAALLSLSLSVSITTASWGPLLLHSAYCAQPSNMSYHFPPSPSPLAGYCAAPPPPPPPCCPSNSGKLSIGWASVLKT